MLLYVFVVCYDYILLLRKRVENIMQKISRNMLNIYDSSTDASSHKNVIL